MTSRTEYFIKFTYKNHLGEGFEIVGSAEDGCFYHGSLTHNLKVSGLWEDLEAVCGNFGEESRVFEVRETREY